jgi:hypothetical protein
MAATISRFGRSGLREQEKQDPPHVREGIDPSPAKARVRDFRKKLIADCQRLIAEKFAGEQSQ